MTFDYAATPSETFKEARELESRFLMEEATDADFEEARELLAAADADDRPAAISAITWAGMKYDKFAEQAVDILLEYWYASPGQSARPP
ncbi:hypothetical protein NJ7G_2398 [Natrinema sp. J7-2]|nr:hypothetical protein NJ7G_2398 [Natrinema sp. J7-2]